jgi:3-methyladenine DNA glycosylase/8-oxoguanine DNA glycosylase
MTLFRGPTTLPFDADAAARALAERDAKLAALIERVGPCKLALSRMQTPFDALAEAIVYQQLSGKAAAAIAARVRERVGATLAPRRLIATSDVELRAAGLSRPKIRALRDLAARSLDGTVPTLSRLMKMDDESIVERLTQVHGIGRWTVEMLLIFRLGRPDVLPVHDYGIRKAFALVYRKRELPAPRALAKLGARWAPHRTVASWYLWRALEDRP